MYFNPFKVSRMSDDDIVKIITEISDECEKVEENSSANLTHIVNRLSDALFLYGELCARLENSLELKKLDNEIKIDKLIQEKKNSSEEKATAGYYKALATEEMKNDYLEEIQEQTNLSRMKRAYDATQEKINALKKKIDTMKYEF